MTITGYAKQFGTSTTTVYRKLSAAGIEPKTLKDERGHLTDSGLSTLSAVMDGTQQRSKPDATVDDTECNTTSAEYVTQLQRQLDATRAELDAANARIQELQQQAIQREHDHAEAWKQYLERQQQIEAQRLLLDAPRAHRGLFTRLHDKLFGKPDDTQTSN